jgi:hypothetical protein
MTNTSNNTHGKTKKAKKKEGSKKKATRSCNCRYAFSILNIKSKL